MILLSLTRTLFAHSLTLSVCLSVCLFLSLFLYFTDKHITRGRGVEVVRIVAVVVVCWDT
jgi:hypothetical protein